MILKTNGFQIEVWEFDSMEGIHNWMGKHSVEDIKNIHYMSRLSDVTEEQAKEWVYEMIKETHDLGWYKNYQATNMNRQTAFWTTLESLKSACSKEWIIVTKTKI